MSDDPTDRSDDARKYALILSLIKPLAPLLADPTITEIMVNDGGRHVFIERDGHIELTGLTLELNGLLAAITKIARFSDDEVADDQPLLTARLPDGSRVSVVLPPCAPDGATMTIRKFGERFTLDELVARGSMPNGVASLLIDAICSKRNILISGGTGTGKTTMLNALADLIPDTDRIVLIEDTSEILIRKPNLVRLQSRRKPLVIGTESAVSPVTITDLVKHALRFRPDRIILGEVRGGEGLDLLEAMNTGHRGSMSTIHGNTAAEALKRLGLCVIQSGVGWPYPAIREAIAMAIQLVVHIERIDGQRRVAQVLEVQGYNMTTDRFDLTPRYTLKPQVEGVLVYE